MSDKESVSLPDSPKTVVQEKKVADSAESSCEYAARFLNKKERTEIFEILLSLLHSNSELSPENQVVKIVGVTPQMVFRWKAKTDTPGPSASAKILSELLKRDPRRTDSRIEAISEKVKREMLKTYIFFLDKELYNFYEIQYEHVRKSTLEYMQSLLSVLLFDEGFEQPQYYSPYYYGQPLGQALSTRTRVQILNRALPDFKTSTEKLKGLLERVQKSLNTWMI